MLQLGMRGARGVCESTQRWRQCLACIAHPFALTSGIIRSSPQTHQPYLCPLPGVPDTWDNLYSFFLNRVRDNLHVILCFSPVGDKFARRYVSGGERSQRAHSCTARAGPSPCLHPCCSKHAS